MDPLDAQILLAVDDDPDATSLALARRLGIARNTLHARLQRMKQAGVLGAFSRRIEPAALGHGLLAFVSIELSQTTGRRATEALRAFPEVIEMHSTTGQGDLLLKVAARDPNDLHRLTGEFLTIEDVVRTNTFISLREEMPLRLRPLVAAIAEAAPRRSPS